MVANVTRSLTSHVQTAQDVFWFVEGPDPSYSVLKFGDNLSSRHWGMAQSMVLHSCDLERLRSSVTSIIFCTSLFAQPVSGRRRKSNSLMDVHTLWRKLRHEGEIWHKSDQHIIWRPFPEPSFGISWGSIHWAIIEIEPPKLCLKSWELLWQNKKITNIVGYLKY